MMMKLKSYNWSDELEREKTALSNCVNSLTVPKHTHVIMTQQLTALY